MRSALRKEVGRLPNRKRYGRGGGGEGFVKTVCRFPIWFVSNVSFAFEEASYSRLSITLSIALGNSTKDPTKLESFNTWQSLIIDAIRLSHLKTSQSFA